MYVTNDTNLEVGYCSIPASEDSIGFHFHTVQYTLQGIKYTFQEPGFHRHMSHELCLVHTGDITIIAENIHITHHGPCVILYKKKTPHAQLNNIKSSYERYNIRLGLDIPLILQPQMQRINQYLNQPAILLPLTDPQLDRLMQAGDSLNGLMEENTDSLPIADSRIVMILGYILAEVVYLLENQSYISQKTCDPYIVKVFEYIMDHITEKITLGDIAAYVHVGKTKLNTDFQKYTSVSITQYIIYERLKLAQKYLQEGCSVETTAMRSGFSDSSHLIHTFQKYFHSTPALYRASFL